MSRKFVDKLGRLNPFGSRCKELPKALPVHSSQRLVRVFVEGYEDVAFWRGVFDRFTNPYLRFEISVPSREDLPKGKKVLLGMIPQASDELLLCVDSDFDYLFHNSTEQSRELLSCDRMFHTYAYATENYLCYAPSLHNVCVRATKNDTRIFDFERFMADYSRIIYPLFSVVRLLGAAGVGTHLHAGRFPCVGAAQLPRNRTQRAADAGVAAPQRRTPRSGVARTPCRDDRTETRFRRKNSSGGA